MKLGFTGTREGMSQHQKEQFALKILELNPIEFHHGDCEGADAQAHDIVRMFLPDTKIVIHPPESDYMRAYKVGDETREPLGYLPRDRNIVNETEYMFGAPLVDDQNANSGTWYTIRYSWSVKRPGTVLPRNQ